MVSRIYYNPFAIIHLTDQPENTNKKRNVTIAESGVNQYVIPPICWSNFYYIFFPELAESRVCSLQATALFRGMNIGKRKMK